METSMKKNYHSTPTMSNVLGCDGMTHISLVFARYNISLDKLTRRVQNNLLLQAKYGCFTKKKLASKDLRDLVSLRGNFTLYF
jgi:hypothetical protein